VLEEIRPDFALVQGDTTTMLVAALACFYRRIPVAHVEAGLRTGDVCSPFPEEANRKLATPLVDLHLAPTQRARANLLAEGVADARVVVTGNTAVDALRFELQRQRTGAVERHIDAALSHELGEGWDARPFVLVTAHRRESLGDGLEHICEALAQLADRFGDHRFIFPVHPNPRVRGPIRARLGGHANVDLVRPMDYGCFVALMSRCRLIVTDSGGVQEEAPTLGKPVVILRETTERIEAIEAGIARLVGTDPARIVDTVAELLLDEDAYQSMIATVNPFGDGEAAARILAAMDRLFVTGS
jgi:UDP-N-acetylglucosamine 2-epimerase (non-hydrolysing)